MSQNLKSFSLKRQDFFVVIFLIIFFNFFGNRQYGEASLDFKKLFKN